MAAFFVVLILRLFRMNSIIRARIGARAAFSAEIRIDGVRSAFRNSFYGAFTNASSARNAGFGINFISHNY